MSDDPTAIIYYHPIVIDNLPGKPTMMGTKPIWDKSPTFFGTQVVKGLIKLQAPLSSTPCDGAYQTRFTVGPSLGKLVYGLGYALSPSEKLMPSRERGNAGEAMVTADAQRGWTKMYGEKSRIGRRLDDIELPQYQRLTPDDPSDDCELHEPKEQENNPLNYSYIATGWEKGILRTLKITHDQVMAEIPPEHSSKFITALEQGAGFFWKNNYKG